MFSESARKKLQENIKFVFSFYDRFINGIEKKIESKNEFDDALEGKDGSKLCVVIKDDKDKSIVLYATNATLSYPHDAFGMKEVYNSVYKITCLPNFMMLESRINTTTSGVREETFSMEEKAGGIIDIDASTRMLLSPKSNKMPGSRQRAIPQEVADYLNDLVNAMQLKMNLSKETQSDYTNLANRLLWC